MWICERTTVNGTDLKNNQTREKTKKDRRMWRTTAVYRRRDRSRRRRRRSVRVKRLKNS
jgi:hypothetical protein